MNSVLVSSSMFGLVITIAGYKLGLLLKEKYKWGFLNPLLISIAFVIMCLLLFNIDYNTYNIGAKYLSYLLTPATVCLAIPLYQQLKLLKKHIKAIIFSILAGVITSLSSIFLLSKLFHLSHEEYVTLLPKSITTAIGIGITEELGGIVSITVASIILTGILGNVMSDLLCRAFKIKNPIAKGLAIGTSSHAIGTAKALEIGEIEGAMSSLSIVISGLLTVIGASLFSNYL